MPEIMTLIEKTVFLKSMEILANVPSEALAQLAARATEVHAEPGEVLFREGEEDRGTFVVIEGLVELRKGDAVVMMLHSGSAHGEFFLEGDEGHQYTGIAREESHLLNIQRDDVVEVLLDSAEFGLALVRAHALRANELMQRVLQLETQLKRFAQALERADIPLPDADDARDARRRG